MNKRLLESKMKAFGDTNNSLAKALGISPQTFSAKKNETNGKEFKQSEIEKIKQRYSLSAYEIDEIFFYREVS